jgi:hypothetical protein
MSTRRAKFLNDYLFQQISLKNILQDYLESNRINDDKNGKEFYKFLEIEIDNRNKTRTDLVELVVDYMFDNNVENISRTESFLNKEYSL